MKDRLAGILPFLNWFPMTRDSLRGDLIAGITVALVLVPQSMAYAQLAGLPVVYGLYASFVPVIVASLWGSSSQLHTGPVAMLSLMSAAALIPFASPGSPHFIELSVMLALMVGVLRLALGLFRMGVIVNFLSSPVIVGFTNAAALIIGLSQLSKILGVPFPRTDFYLRDLWNVFAQIPETHWATLAFALGAWAVIHFGRRLSPSFPGVLAAVVLATVASAWWGFEQKRTVALERVEAPEFGAAVQRYAQQEERIQAFTDRLSQLNSQLRKETGMVGAEGQASRSALEAEVSRLNRELAALKSANNALRIRLHEFQLSPSEAGGDTVFRTVGSGTEGGSWRFAGVEAGEVTLSAGGAVVGEIPQGLPAPSMPSLQWDLIPALLPAAFVMALIGFMEATSISKAIAARTGERIDTSKELVGQGLANIAGSFFGSYTVSGSFSRSAVASRTGATTGLFAIISALGVVLVLLYLTPYLYHLPQAVLAVIVMTAVFGLIRVKPLVQAWKVERPSAVIGLLTFVATLYMAPDLANGILLGVVLTILWYLVRTMRPRTEIVARQPDGTLGGIEAHQLEPLSQHFVPVRFDGSLTFVNVAYFEDMLLEALADYPDARAILVIGSGINEIDATGEETIRELAKRLQDRGVQLTFSSLKQQVRQVFERSGLTELIGPDNFFTDKESALKNLRTTYA
ncbi:sulfate transporter [Thiohalorhabdus denitrificans]|uniref:Anti-anti-sigma factor n=1 Tax=Thiohalorhabdus denitrificans TaxID=381306 RepID=A0A0P9GGS7_9GAMM|nr:SulP family inorganic anion transporter [Thiohalorhabdus denitrificans]KPV39235.1 sulfate transporter [Thiohalorhabdus denitrificans]SCX74995.1 anti-anti-sigma factor [Thiohalorhabdus denitrificans]